MLRDERVRGLRELRQPQVGELHSALARLKRNDNVFGADSKKRWRTDLSQPIRQAIAMPLSIAKESGWH